MRDLLDVGDGGASADSDLAVVGLLFAGEHCEKSRLTGAVGTDEADAVAVVDLEGKILKERRGAEAVVGFGVGSGFEEAIDEVGVGEFEFRLCGRLRRDRCQ